MIKFVAGDYFLCISLFAFSVNYVSVSYAERLK